MSMSAMTRPVLFEAGPWRARPMGAGDAPWLQAFLDANPLYFVTVNGRPAGPGDALAELTERPPADMTYRELHWLAFVDEAGSLQGVANVLSDLLAPGVWHTGLFIVATALHGTGAARMLYEALEAWMRRDGAQWLRLGVVLGNARAEAFWQRAGYSEVRQRSNVDTGGRLNTIRVMAKPLAVDAFFEDYLAMVPRDRPEAGQE
jgi:GNAT superfamily N-acetyltransferase